MHFLEVLFLNQEEYQKNQPAYHFRKILRLSLSSVQLFWVVLWLQQPFSMPFKNQCQYELVKTELKMTNWNGYSVHNSWIHTHHGMVVHKILVTPLWWFTRLMKTLVYIKKCYMVTLYKLLKDQIKLLKKTVRTTHCYRKTLVLHSKKVVNWITIKFFTKE
jgi:hypothetical protein